MMELLHVCDPQTEDCDTLCSGGKCGWKECAEGDDDCLRALEATECLLDPSRCPDALLRCTTCDEENACPPAASCSEEPNLDGKTRCVPDAPAE
jgi:hypothetical protein